MASREQHFADKVWGLIWILSAILAVGSWMGLFSYHRHRSASQALDTHLRADFVAFDDEYFGGDLSKNTIVTYIDNGPDADIGDTECNLVCSINVNAYYDRSEKEADMTLLHEMCHADLFTRHEYEYDPHGPKWEACMHQLADERAFDQLW